MGDVSGQSGPKTHVTLREGARASSAMTIRDPRPKPAWNKLGLLDPTPFSGLYPDEVPVRDTKEGLRVSYTYIFWIALAVCIEWVIGSECL